MIINPGNHNGGETPDPIPNSEVKPSSADGTAGGTPWESRSLPGFFLPKKGGTQTIFPFFFLPQVLVLDEPLSGLDITTALVVRELVRKLSEEGKIVIYSSHILDMVEKVASRVIILHQGRVQADDSVESLRELMNVPSLEEIFKDLAIQVNPLDRASELI